MDISIDPFTGRNPGYCFVDLDPTEDVQLAMDVMQGQTIRGRQVKINFSTAKAPREGRRPTIVYDHGSQAREVATPNVTSEAYVFDRWARQDADSHWTAPPEEKRRLFVGGLPRIPSQDVVNAEMRELFEGWNIQAVSKIITPVNPQRSQYYCFVDLPTSQDALEAAAALNGRSTPYRGTYEIQLARQKGPTKVQREQLSAPRDSVRRERSRPELLTSWRRA